MPLRVTVVGRVGVEVDAMPTRAPGVGKPAQVAFAYLVSERHRPVRKDELADVVWGDELPASWEQMLRGIVLRLRGMLAQAGLDAGTALSTGSGGYQVHLPPESVVDVEEAAASLDAAVAALDSGYAGAARAKATNAARIAAGGFAPGTTGRWVEARQAEVTELHLRALDAVARAALAEGDNAGAEIAAEEALSIEPYRESSYLALIEAHARGGNRAKALRAYERCRKILAEELGVNPSAPIEAAYLALLSDTDSSLDAPSGAVALPVPAELLALPHSFLVGRAAELDLLESALKQATVDGRRGVLVGGEPGVGKTSLVACAARDAHQGGARVLYGRCDEGLGLPYQPFVEALDHYVAHCPLQELRAHVATHGGTLSALVPTLMRRLPDVILPATTGDAETDRWRLFEAVAGLLEVATAPAPVVLVLDDLHWATTPTIMLLRHLISKLSAAALLVVATYRDSEIDVTPALTAALADLRRVPVVDRIDLKGLDADGVTAFVNAYGAIDGDAEITETLRHRTAGNPFFMGELLRHAGDTGEGLAYAVPDGIAEVLARRIDRLSTAAQEALVVGAVIGDEFEVELVERLVADAESALDGIEETVAARLVVEVPRPVGRHQFAHALVRDAVYGRLSVTRRARLHQRVGEALESVPGDDDLQRVAELAHHFTEAASPACVVKAADYALRAASLAADLAAWEQGVAFCDAGLGALQRVDSPDDVRTFELLARKAELLGNLAELDLTEVWKASLAAFAAARRVGSPEALTRAAAAYNHPRRPGGEVGRQLCDEALAALGTEPNPRLRALLLISLAQTGTASEADVARMSSEALELARTAEDLLTLRWARRLRASTLLGSPYVQALTDICGEMMGEERDRMQQAIGHRFVVAARLIAGDRDGFDAEANDLDRCSRELRMWLYRDTAELCRRTAAFLDGRLSEVDGRLADIPKVHGASAMPAGVTALKASLLFEEGRFEDLSMLEPLVTGGSAPHLRAIQAHGAVESGRLDDARTAVQGCCADLASIHRHFAAVVSARLAEVIYGLDEADMAPLLRCNLEPYAGLVLVIGFGALCAGPADRPLALAAALVGDEQAAVRHFESALRVAANLRSPLFVAHTQCDYGQFLLRRAGPGDEVRGRDLVSRAAAAAARLELAAVSKRATRLLA